ncbi:MAG: S1 RNA-binding domain-containing protein [Candidatus Promineifilaceae bacterium]
MEENNATPVEPTETANPTSIDELEPKMKVNGTVSRLELYGAFIDIGVGTNALIHISKLGKEHVNRVSDVLQVGDEVSVWIERVDPEQEQIMVSMVEPLAVEWSDLRKGEAFSGTVARLESYGAFVDIGAEREGLVHISEISHDYVKNPSEKLSVGDVVQVEVLDFSKRKRRIDLSIKNLLEKPESAAQADTSYRAQEVTEEFEEEFEEVPTAMEVALRKAMGDDSIDALEGQSKRTGKKSKKKQRAAQDDLLDRTLQYQKNG